MESPTSPSPIYVLFDVTWPKLTNVKHDIKKYIMLSIIKKTQNVNVSMIMTIWGFSGWVETKPKLQLAGGRGGGKQRYLGGAGGGL